MPTITALNIYPVKSCKGVALKEARIGATGLEHDREWLIVRPDGRFITQREEPRLALIEPSLDATHLRLEAPGMQPLEVPANLQSNPVEVTCWRDRCSAFDAGVEAERWLERYLGSPHRLVRFDPAHRRVASMDWTRGVEALNQFSDGFPFLVISQASLDDLNSRLASPVPMDRFRPNFVVEGSEAFAEDGWKKIAIGETVFHVVKPCARCVIPTIDQTTGVSTGKEPTKTLATYRNFGGKVHFGQNLIAEKAGGRIKPGDEVKILETN